MINVTSSVSSIKIVCVCFDDVITNKWHPIGANWKGYMWKRRSLSFTHSMVITLAHYFCFFTSSSYVSLPIIFRLSFCFSLSLTRSFLSNYCPINPTLAQCIDMKLMVLRGRGLDCVCWGTFLLVLCQINYVSISFFFFLFLTCSLESQSLKDNERVTGMEKSAWHQMSRERETKNVHKINPLMPKNNPFSLLTRFCSRLSQK
jgi:hypothetical protein